MLTSKIKTYFTAINQIIHQHTVKHTTKGGRFYRIHLKMYPRLGTLKEVK